MGNRKWSINMNITNKRWFRRLIGGKWYLNIDNETINPISGLWSLNQYMLEYKWSRKKGKWVLAYDTKKGTFYRRKYNPLIFTMTDNYSILNNIDLTININLAFWANNKNKIIYEYKKTLV
jgi:hypothetical protein